MIMKMGVFFLSISLAGQHSSACELSWLGPLVRQLVQPEFTFGTEAAELLSRSPCLWFTLRKFQCFMEFFAKG